MCGNSTSLKTINQVFKLICFILFLFENVSCKLVVIIEKNASKLRKFAKNMISVKFEKFYLVVIEGS